jgi:glucose-1-phosphate thymidylyltransferase
MQALGIILAAGKSSRLYPSTLVTTKQLLPIYDKPLIYYPLTTLMLAGIKDFIIISSPHEASNFQKLFSTARRELGINVTILVQETSVGIADAFRIVGDALGSKIFEFDVHALILGDNIFYGAGLSGLLKSIDPLKANVFLYQVQHPEEFGVAEVVNGTVVSIEEKPTAPKSNLAITGMYFYPPSVYLYANQIVPSPRGELEITDINELYLQQRELNAINLLRGMVWFDTGTPDAMLEASNFVQNIQKHQNYLIGSPHEVAIKNKWVTVDDVQPFIKLCDKTPYGKYLSGLFKL